jgi:hypothetical protein
LYLYWNPPKPLPPENIDQVQSWNKAMAKSERESEVIFTRVGFRLNLLELENVWRDVKDVMFEKSLLNAKIV